MNKPKELTISSHAKINMSLDVIGKLPNGYHEICMIMQTLELHDTIHIHLQEHSSNITISCSNPFVPCNDKNIAYKAAKALKDRFPDSFEDSGVVIDIIKRIPVAAGLAGGSGNAAAVLKGLDKIYNLNIPSSDLSKIALELGADVPYCLTGGTMLSEGIGEVLTPLVSCPKSNVLLVNPKKPLSTSNVYKSIVDVSSLPHSDIKLLRAALEKGDLHSFFSETANSLEGPAFDILPEVRTLKKLMYAKGAYGAMMSGSGPTVYGFFESEQEMANAGFFFRKRGCTAICTKTFTPIS